MTGVLIIIAILLIFLVVVQIARASELAAVIKGKDKSEDNSRLHAALSIIFLVLGMIILIWSVFYYIDDFLPIAASEHGHLIDNNFNITLFFTGIVFIATQILLFYFVYKYRQTKKRQAYFYPDNNKLELLWTLIPAIVLTFLVVKGMTSWYVITGPEPEGSLEIEATGKQFQWMIRYPGVDGEFGEIMLDSVSATNMFGMQWRDPSGHDDFAPNEIHLPVNKSVLVRIRAHDVIHSFFLPHFRVKWDAVPGVPGRFWFTPTITTEEMRKITGNPDFNYELACAEHCGRGHYSMRTSVVVESEEKYNEWLSNKTSYYQQTMMSGGQPATTAEANPVSADADTAAVNM